MTQALVKSQAAGEIVERVVVLGDLSRLTPEERTHYYKAVCESVGLNPLTRPFEYITLNNKLTLYARKDATDQLRKIHGVSVTIASRERVEDAYIVTARATDKAGRADESIGAVSIANLKGENLCNAIMKAETKAKRRVTLSICGLGMLDENEIETIPDARQWSEPEPTATDTPRQEATAARTPQQIALDAQQPLGAEEWERKHAEINAEIVATAQALGIAPLKLQNRLAAEYHTDGTLNSLDYETKQQVLSRLVNAKAKREEGRAA
jgi:hypothetical protein